MGREQNVTLGERLALALISIVAASFTVALMWFAALFAGAIVTIEYAKTKVPAAHARHSLFITDPACPRHPLRSPRSIPV